MNQVLLRLNTKLLLIVTVRKNAQCPEADSSVMVTFGAGPVAGGDCEEQWNSTEETVSSGDSASFHVDTANIFLTSNEIYCFVVSLDGVPGEWNIGSRRK